jgi:predicted MFS family arabinose efflux permease
MGIFSSAQFVGVFLGGWLSGMALEAYGADAVLEVWLGLVVVWALVLIISDPMSPQATKAAK